MKQCRMDLYQLRAGIQARLKIGGALNSSNRHQRKSLTAEAVQMLDLLAGLRLLTLVLPVAVALTR